MDDYQSDVAGIGSLVVEETLTIPHWEMSAPGPMIYWGLGDAESKHTVTSVVKHQLDRSDILICPHPSRERISIMHSRKPVALVVYDAIGRLQHKTNIHRPGETRLHVSGYPRGMYSIKFTYEGKCIVKKVIIQ